MLIIKNYHCNKPPPFSKPPIIGKLVIWTGIHILKWRKKKKRGGGFGLGCKGSGNGIKISFLFCQIFLLLRDGCLFGSESFQLFLVLGWWVLEVWHHVVREMWWGWVKLLWIYGILRWILLFHYNFYGFESMGFCNFVSPGGKIEMKHDKLILVSWGFKIKFQTKLGFLRIFNCKYFYFINGIKFIVMEGFFLFF